MGKLRVGHLVEAGLVARACACSSTSTPFEFDQGHRNLQVRRERVAARDHPFDGSSPRLGQLAHHWVNEATKPRRRPDQRRGRRRLRGSRARGAPRRSFKWYAVDTSRLLAHPVCIYMRVPDWIASYDRGRGRPACTFYGSSVAAILTANYRLLPSAFTAMRVALVTLPLFFAAQCWKTIGFYYPGAIFHHRGNVRVRRTTRQMDGSDHGADSMAC